MPVLNVAGWWDAEDFYGPLKIYETLEQMDSKGQNYLVVGPWMHGGWSRSDGDKLGAIDFDQKTSQHYRSDVQARWFAYQLKGKGKWTVEEAYTFRTGSNEWVNNSTWPPNEDIIQKKLFLTSDSKLSFAMNLGTNDYDEFISDPANPVPYSKRPIQGFWQDISSKALWKVEDQRFVHGRPDILSYETKTLEEDVTISGDIIMNLFASTSGTDSDWIVKLIDVYPESIEDDRLMSGYQLMIADEVVRAKFRNGFEKPEPLIANQVEGYSIDLNSRHHTFKKGHRIMLQIQSTWFPLIDRNPQKFIDIPNADQSDYQKATQKVYYSNSFQSHLILPVVSSN